MKITRFIENRYQELTLQENQRSSTQGYSLLNDAETKALHKLLSILRICTMWALIPKVLFHYAAVLFGWSREPKPVLANMLKDQKDKEDQKKLEKTAKKVGMLESVKLPQEPAPPSAG